MKKETHDFLIDFISSTPYSKYIGYDFDMLFKMYSALEIKKLSDVYGKSKEFIDFLNKYDYLITTADPEYQKRIPDKIKALEYRFKTYFTTRNKGDQKIFGDIVTTIAPSKRQTKTLDVGPSKFPYSSITMAKKLDNVSCMDEEFLLSQETLKAMNVTPREEMFTEKTSIIDHDFIVGRFPCSAIIPIVKACTKENKPYFIELCECGIPWPKVWPEGHSFGWENVLPEIDPNVHIMNGYAFNIDASESQIMKIINKQTMKKFFNIKNGNYTLKKDIPVTTKTVVISSGAWKKDPEELEMI